MVIPVKSVPKILVSDILSPFYIFQIFSIILWCANYYLYYAATIFIISVGTILIQLFETRSNLKNLQKMAFYECNVKVLRRELSLSDPDFIEVVSSELVPGDIIDIRGLERHKMPCDALMLSGSAIVNESMLTGESVPMIKNEIPRTIDRFNPESDSKYILFNGTEVI